MSADLHIKNNGNQKMRDKFCWFCHLPETTLNCSTCIRSFHKDCYGNENEQQCLQCKKVANSRKVSVISKQKLNLSLKYICRRLTDNDEFKELIHIAQHDVIVPMNLKLLEANIGECKYDTTTDFLTDVLWLQHNSLITDCCHRMKQITKNLVTFCEREIVDIEACDECYQLGNQNNPKWFSMVCSKLHPLVWAKIIGYPYQPAKVMKVQHDVISVYFFGDHKAAMVPAKSCYQYSEKSPNNLSHKMDASVMKEVAEYIQNLGTSFKYADYGKEFDLNAFKHYSMPTQAESKQPNNLRDAINKLIDESEAKLISITNELQSTKEEFVKKEMEYLELIKDLRNKLMNQKARHDDEMKNAVQAAKKKIWCSQCTEKPVMASPHFCSNACGLKWHQMALTRPG